MIVLDADVLIGLLDERDAHNPAANALLLEHAGSEFGATSVTLAESLVAPARAGREDAGWASLQELGIRELTLMAGAAPLLAGVRAATGLRMPDCLALIAARTEQATLASFDERLRRSAQVLGVETLP